MDAAYLSAVSALAGSVIGGLTTGFTTWLSQRSQARAGMIVDDLGRREDLVRDFIVAASKTYDDALVSSGPKMPTARRSLCHGQPDARRGHGADG